MNTPAAQAPLDSQRFPRTALLQSLPARFEEIAAAHAGNLAVDDGTRSLTYRQLNTEANRLAHAVIAQGSSRNLPVCLLFGQSATLLVAILGVLKAGRAYVPLEPSDPIAELEWIVRDTDAGLVISDAKHADLAQKLAGNGRSSLIAETVTGVGDGSDPGLAVEPGHTACIYYTSGTTGQPKGVVDVHRNVMHNVMRYTNTLAICAEDRLSLIQSCNFSGTVSTIFSALLNGASVFPFDLRRQGIERLAQWAAVKRLTMFHGVPLIFEQLLRTGVKLPSLRLIRLEGDQMHLRHLHLFKEYFVQGCMLVNGLGTTETGLVRQFFVGHETVVEGPIMPIGYPVCDMDIVIRRDDGSLAEAGEVGEIVVRSAYLAQGYWRRPDLTAAKFSVDPGDPARRVYSTGDLGRMRADGCLEHLGRNSFDAKLRGRRIELAEVENALCSIPGVRHALVKVDEGTVRSQQLVAYVVRDGKAAPTATGIRRALSRHLADWLIPAHFVFLDALPADRHGKLARQLLPQRPLERPRVDTPFRQPDTSVEQELARCFSEVLKVQPVGADDDFFELGGDSLLAAELAACAGEALEKRLSPEAVFDHPTVAALAKHLVSGIPAAMVFPLRGSGENPALFCVHVRNDQPSGFRHLARLLGEDQPVYVLRDAPINMRIEDLARSYIDAMQGIQPHGPYRLCGNCVAGIVAYEMARQLLEKGEQVVLLALIDTAFPPKSPEINDRFHGYRKNWRKLISASELAARAARLGEALRLPYPSGWLDSRQALRIAEKRYRPPLYHGRTVLFIAGSLGNQRGWQDVCKGGLEVVGVGPLDWADKADRPHLIASSEVGDLAPVLLNFLREYRHA